MFEVNLVPDVKAEMLKAQKIRNIVVFVCFAIVAIAGGLIAILGGIKAGQDIKMSTQDSSLKELSTKINSFSDINELLTIQGQLDGLKTIGEKKVLFSRVFGIINAVLPTNGDEISLSELNVDLAQNTLKFEAQADAKNEPLIDYRVLDAFKKSMTLMKYDYGTFVDEEGREIPNVCVVEADENGEPLVEDGVHYAVWARGVEGCNTSEEMQGNNNGANNVISNNTVQNNDGTEANNNEKKDVSQVLESDVRAAMNDVASVKIWRVPKFDEWSKNGYLTNDGKISGVPHFESQCIVYQNMDSRWTSNNSCNLIPEEMQISESSNARDASENLVLRFTATIKIDHNALLAKNKNMMMLAPTGYTNVTDSYMQVAGMFKQKANDCEKEDTACLEAQTKESDEKSR